MSIFNGTTQINVYPLSLHDALPIFEKQCPEVIDLRKISLGFRAALVADDSNQLRRWVEGAKHSEFGPVVRRSEEHTSELQSRRELVCRLLLEKKINVRRYVIACCSC